MPVFKMMIGVPGSGKSYHVTECLKDHPDMKWVVLSTDNFIENYAASLGQTYSEAFKSAIGPAEEQFWSDLKKAVEDGRNIIVDRTNLSHKSRLKLLAQLTADYHKIACVVSTPEPNEWQRRLESRPGKIIPQSVLDDMVERWKQPRQEEGFDEIDNIN